MYKALRDLRLSSTGLISHFERMNSSPGNEPCCDSIRAGALNPFSRLCGLRRQRVLRPQFVMLQALGGDRSTFMRVVVMDVNVRLSRSGDELLSLWWCLDDNILGKAMCGEACLSLSSPVTCHPNTGNRRHYVMILTRLTGTPGLGTGPVGRTSTPLRTIDNTAV
jgi:hypothetical protein